MDEQAVRASAKGLEFSLKKSYLQDRGFGAAKRQLHHKATVRASKEKISTSVRRVLLYVMVPSL